MHPSFLSTVGAAVAVISIVAVGCSSSPDAHADGDAAPMGVTDASRDESVLDASAPDGASLDGGPEPGDAENRETHESDADAANECPPALTTCGGMCVDLSTNGHHCGACEHDCLGSSCRAGRCEPILLAKGQQGITVVAVDATDVYWMTTGIMKCAIGGCSAPSLLSASAHGGLGVNGTGVYFTAAVLGPGGDFSSMQAVVMKCPFGGPCAELHNSGLGTQPYALALDSGSVYWIKRSSVSSAGGEAVLKCGLDGQTCYTVTAATGPNHDLGLAVDSNRLYWTAGSAVFACVKTGANPPQMLTSGQTPFAVAVDAQNLYFTDNGDGTVRKCAVTGCVQPTVLASALAQPNGIAVDSTTVYWTNRGDGTVKSCDISGCAQPTIVASGQNDPYGIAVDGNAVYWTNQGPSGGDGTVMKLAK